jgi:hypothetical protein
MYKLELIVNEDGGHKFAPTYALVCALIPAEWEQEVYFEHGGIERHALPESAIVIEDDGTLDDWIGYCCNRCQDSPSQEWLNQHRSTAEAEAEVEIQELNNWNALLDKGIQVIEIPGYSVGAYHPTEGNPLSHLSDKWGNVSAQYEYVLADGTKTRSRRKDAFPKLKDVPTLEDRTQQLLQWKWAEGWNCRALSVLLGVDIAEAGPIGQTF